jgi:hypothetical protein
MDAYSLLLGIPLVAKFVPAFPTRSKVSSATWLLYVTAGCLEFEVCELD